MSAAMVLQGCAATDVTPGVYIVEPTDGVPGWIGSPGGAPVWAPDGNALAWGTEDGLFRRDLTSNSPMLLAAEPIAGRPAWSPDGRSLAFVDQRRAALIVLEAGTGSVRFSTPIVTAEAAHDYLALPVLGGPAWSPDGSRLAFNCWDGAGDEICVIRTDGTDFRQVTRIAPRMVMSEPSKDVFVQAVANTGPPAWAPDSNSLAVAAYPEQRGAAKGVFVVDLERGTARRVSSVQPNSEIAWFPDGESLVFSASEKGRSDVLRVSVTDDSVENITEGLASGAREPALSPDGSRLAVASGGAIVVVNLVGTIEISRVSPFDQRLPAWSPRGDAIAYTAAPNPISSYS